MKFRNAAAGESLYIKYGDISVTNKRIDTYATSPEAETDFRQINLRNGASAIFISYNLRDNITQPVITVTEIQRMAERRRARSVLRPGAQRIVPQFPQTCQILRLRQYLRSCVYKIHQSCRQPEGIADNIWLGVPDNTVITC